jgi:penicillin-binding protein 1A
MPAYIWRTFMREVIPKYAWSDFARPSGIVTARVSAEDGLLVSNSADNKGTHEEVFIQGTEPSKYSPKDKDEKKDAKNKDGDPLLEDEEKDTAGSKVKKDISERINRESPPPPPPKQPLILEDPPALEKPPSLPEPPADEPPLAPPPPRTPAPSPAPPRL